MIVVLARGPDSSTTRAFAAHVRAAAATFINSLMQLYGVESVQGAPMLTAVDAPLDRRGAVVPLEMAVLLPLISLGSGT